MVIYIYVYIYIYTHVYESGWEAGSMGAPAQQSLMRIPSGLGLGAWGLRLEAWRVEN